MNSTSAVRIVWSCLPPTIHYRSLPTGTQWLGHGPKLLGDIADRMPPYELAAGEKGVRKVNMMLDDKADILPMLYGYTHQRYQG